MKRNTVSAIIGKALGLCLLTLSASARSQVSVANPGFEDGENGWHFFQGNGGHDNVMVDSTVAHSGQKSAKLFLRTWGGYVDQDIYVSLAAGTHLRMTFYALMPFAGDWNNKVFSSSLTAFAGDNSSVYSGHEQLDPLTDWTRIEYNLTLPFDTNHLLIDCSTGAGWGSNQNYDKPVWVDDFQIEVVPEPGAWLALGVAFVPLLRRRRVA